MQADNCPITSLEPLRNQPVRIIKVNNSLITDLSPLQGKPMRTLHIEFTRVSNLAAISGMPLYSLAAYGVPVPDSVYETITAIPLGFLTLDITDPKARAAVRAMPYVTYVNYHVRPHTLAFIDLLDSVSSPAQAQRILMKQAFRYGSAAYYAVPLVMTCKEAQQFCARYGASIASPETFDEFRAIYKYIEGLCAEFTSYHIGMRTNPITGEKGYLEGVTPLDRVWASPFEKERSQKTGLAKFYGAAHRYRMGITAEEKACFVMEWE